jgi:sporadic carbohydrate cluster 2OG-Fe(II) oxygenase
MSHQLAVNKFKRDGWVIINLSPQSLAIISRIQKIFKKRLAEKWGILLKNLEDYHEVVIDDDLHTMIQTDLSKLFHENGYGQMIVERSVESFNALLGLDLHIQKYPYVRISRPQKHQDNIGIHRDTHYGCSPYEVSVSIPFTTVPAKGSLGVLSGTHLLSEEALPFEQIRSADVEKNSTKHKLGFLYAPKVMSDEVRNSVKPVTLKVGQALAFSLSLVHGQEVNQSKATRISTDVRLVNSFAPIQWSRNVHSDYYEPFCASVVTQQAKIYAAANNLSENKVIKL